MEEGILRSIVWLVAHFDCFAVMGGKKKKWKYSCSNGGGDPVSEPRLSMIPLSGPQRRGNEPYNVTPTATTNYAVT